MSIFQSFVKRLLSETSRREIAETVFGGDGHLVASLIQLVQPHTTRPTSTIRLHVELAIRNAAVEGLNHLVADKKLRESLTVTLGEMPKNTQTAVLAIAKELQVRESV